MGYAVSPKPTAATLENDFRGQRSGTRPLLALVVSQNPSTVRRSTVSRNASCAAVAVNGLPVPLTLTALLPTCTPSNARTKAFTAVTYEGMKPVSSPPLDTAAP